MIGRRVGRKGVGEGYRGRGGERGGKEAVREVGKEVVRRVGKEVVKAVGRRSERVW